MAAAVVDRVDGVVGVGGVLADPGKLGLALIPEDRKTEGLMLPMSVRDNVSMASITRLTRGITVDRQAEKSRIAEMVRQLKIKVDDTANPVATL